MNCPVNCKYCMASYVSKRADYWDDGYRLGINKSCVFVNRLLKDPPLSKMNMPFELMHNDFVGFQGITDCFWDKYIEDLAYITSMVNKYNIRKLTLISKIPISNEQISILNDIKNRLTICYSVTGLDDYENTTSASRVKSLALLRSKGFDVFPVMHPYIDGLSDYKGVIDMLHSKGFNEMNWKGFRHDLRMTDMPKLTQYPIDGDERLIGEKKLIEYAEKKNIHFVDLKERLHQTTIQGITREIAEQEVDALLLKKIVISSSASKEEVREYAIKRRL